MSVSILGVEQPPNNSQQLGEDLREWTSSEFQKFLEEFREGKSRDGELEPQDSQTVGRAEAENGPKYLAILGQMASEERETLDIDYEDIDQWYQDLALVRLRRRSAAPLLLNARP